MTPQTASQPRKSEAQPRTVEEAHREASKRDTSLTPQRVVTRPEDDKYFDPPCTD